MVEYLSRHVSLSEELKGIIVESAILKTLKKGTVISQKGNSSNENYFVLKGCIRSYIVRDGEETTLEFYTEEHPISPIPQANDEHSAYFLECLEDCLVNVSTPEHENEMFLKFPQFESICRIMAEVMIATYQKTFTDYRMATPEDRYLNLMKTRPDLFQRVPLYQLSSYLGVKPESLSRIRKRLMKK